MTPQGVAVLASDAWSAKKGCDALSVALTGDQGGKAILDAHRNDLHLCPVEDPGILKDIDQLSQLM